MHKIPHNYIDLTGCYFNDWCVLGRGPNYPSSGRVRWLCRCLCGQQNLVDTTSLKNGKSKRCKQCSQQGSRHPRWVGVGDISGDYWGKLLIGTERRNIEFSISITEAWRCFLQQKRMCALTGAMLVFKSRHYGKQTASLDRIDSTKGYVTGNIQWVHKDINRIKSNMNQARFIELCIKVANCHKSNTL